MTRLLRSHFGCWIAAVALTAGAFASTSTAGDLEKLDTSLKLVPEDAAFYSAMLRNREQIEAIGNSRAWKRIMDMPAVQTGLMMYQMQAADPESAPAMIEAALSNPETRRMIDTGLDMVSHEIFVYGDRDFVGFVNLLQQIMGAGQLGPLMAAADPSQGMDMAPDQVQAAMLMGVMSENLDLIKVPNLIIGFKLKDTDRAAAQLEQLHAMATIVLGSNPQLQGRYKMTDVDGHQFMTLSVDGEMIPWDEVHIENIPIERAKANKVLKRLRKLQLVVALGIRDDYLLLSIGSSTDCLARLGKETSLATRPEFAPLDKFAGERLTSINYVSKALNEQVATTKEDIDGLVELADMMLDEAGLPPQLAARLRKDAAALAEDIKQEIPEPGATVGLNFLTDDGIEGYQYDYSEHKQLDGSKPLGLLSHLGGNPILAIIGRGKDSPESYDLLVKWMTTVWGYVGEFGVPQMAPPEREKFEEVVTLVRPLLKRLDNANRKMLIPALGDGQIGLVVDAKLESRHFIQALPPTERPMPMLEPALLVGVSDAALLLQGCREYGAVLKELVGVIRQIEPRSIPEDFQIPDPSITATGSGKIYKFALPKQLGVDPRIVPNFGLGESVAVFSLSLGHTARLLKKTPAEIGGALADPNRPRATAVFFDFAGLVDAATPWVDLAVDALEAEWGYADDSVRDQVHTVLQVLKALRGMSSESYFEGGALVTHWKLHIRDIE